MNVFRLSISLLVFFVLGTTISKSQDVGNSNRQQIRNDSLLNVITDVEKRVMDAAIKNAKKDFLYQAKPIEATTIDSSIKSVEVPLAEKKLSLYTSPFDVREKNGLLVKPFSWTPFADSITMRDTVIINIRLLPVPFEGEILPENLDFRSKSKSNKEFTLINPDSTFSSSLERVRQVHKVRKLYYTQNPEKIRLDMFSPDTSFVWGENIIEKRSIFDELLATEKPKEAQKLVLEKTAIKPVFWQKSGEHDVKVSQIGFSNNWKGEKKDNVFAVLNNHKMNINYKKKKLSLENMIEWRLEFMSSPADTMHTVSIQNDYLKINSVLGYEAFSKWSYTLNWLLVTPLFNSYEKNKPNKKSAFFSPFELNLGLGMRYVLERKSKDNKYNKTKFTVNLAPLSLNYKYVKDSSVDETSKGLKKGEKSKTEIGSTVDMNFVRNFNNYTSFTSRLRYFTNYERVEAESENKFTFQINRYFSTSLFLHMRFDDSVSKKIKDESKIGYFQINEVIGIGLGYRW